MKNSSTLLLVSFITVTISVLGVSCNDDLQCKDLNMKCENDIDCCSQNCKWSYNHLFEKYCQESVMVQDKNNNYIPKNARALCKFDDTFVNDTYSEDLFKKFKINASYKKLSPQTIIEVTYNNKTVFVQINDYRPDSSDKETIYLSKQAARILNIKSHEGVPCDLQALKINNHTTTDQWIMFGIFFIIAILLIYQQVSLVLF